MKRALAVSVMSFSALTVSCMAQVGAAATAGVPRDAATTCASYCTDMQMTLSAVVVMANNVGCVCNPTKTATMEDKAAASAGGMAAILAAEEEQRQQETIRTSHHH